MSNCIFCNLPKDRVVFENDLAIAIYDGFPVTDLHALIIPKRHTENYFKLTNNELFSCNQLLKEFEIEVNKKDNLVQGFNIGINTGDVAGQTIFHCHIHLIPRRQGDVDNPRGGVRNIIPGKGDY